MYFIKNEKVFSLARTAAAPPYSDISALFSEFYCYLLVAGLFREGEAPKAVRYKLPPISDKNFLIPEGSYQYGLGTLIAKGLKDRFKALRSNTQLTEKEDEILGLFDLIFTEDKSWFAHLSAKDIMGIAHARQFSPDMMTIAHYVSVAFGQKDYAARAVVPRLYLSLFGNIHLAKPDTAQVSGPRSDSVILDAPQLRYGSAGEDGADVTALWAILSAQITSLSTLCDAPYVGDNLAEMLSSLSFLMDDKNSQNYIPIPYYASSLYMKRLFGLDGYNPVSVSALFYQEFLYGSSSCLKLSRQSLLIFILNLMMEKMGETHLSHLFMSNSYYRKLLNTNDLQGKSPKRPALFQFALETLAPDEVPEEDPSNDDTALPVEDPVTDPTTDDAGYDPTTPPPAMPVGVPTTDENTIGLISFDKSGEGVNEHLYRLAVVALNDRLRSDDTLPFESDVKDALDYWVNGFLWLTAISATKEQITTLKLQAYLKPVSTKG